MAADFNEQKIKASEMWSLSNANAYNGVLWHTLWVQIH